INTYRLATKMPALSECEKLNSEPLDSTAIIVRRRPPAIDGIEAAHCWNHLPSMAEVGATSVRADSATPNSTILIGLSAMFGATVEFSARAVDFGGPSRTSTLAPEFGSRATCPSRFQTTGVSESPHLPKVELSFI